jgi:hypothetical protein
VAQLFSLGIIAHYDHHAIHTFDFGSDVCFGGRMRFAKAGLRSSSQNAEACQFGRDMDWI